MADLGIVCSVQVCMCNPTQEMACCQMPTHSYHTVFYRVSMIEHCRPSQAVLHCTFVWIPGWKYCVTNKEATCFILMFQIQRIIYAAHLQQSRCWIHVCISRWPKISDLRTTQLLILWPSSKHAAVQYFKPLLLGSLGRVVIRVFCWKYVTFPTCTMLLTQTADDTSIYLLRT